MFAGICFDNFRESGGELIGLVLEVKLGDYPSVFIDAGIVGRVEYPISPCELSSFVFFKILLHKFLKRKNFSSDLKTVSFVTCKIRGI